MAMFGKRTWHTIASVCGACIVFYFIYHTVQGDRGWLAMLRLKNEVEMAKSALAQLQQEHKQLDHRVQLLRPGSIDPDLLDEKSREMLNLSKPNDIVILTPPDTKNADPQNKNAPGK